MQHDLIIIGGGAAGLTAAIFAAQGIAGRSILILDASTSLGQKLLLSGGGRCNITHDVVRPEDYNGARNIIKNVLAAFDAAAAARWFEGLGVQLKLEEQTGKLFPASDCARTVLAALVGRATELGVQVQTCSRVTEATAKADGFELVTGAGPFACRRLILATGGRSLPRTGSDGSGLALARRLGHTVTPTSPGLVPLVLARGFFHTRLSGVTQEVELTTVVGPKRIDQRSGNLLWTHFGISGPAAMDASRHWVVAHEGGLVPRLLANFLPGDTREDAEAWILSQCSLRPRAVIRTLLASRLPERLGTGVLGQAGIDPNTPGGQLTREARKLLAAALTSLELPVTGHRGWDQAEVTAGGVPLNEIDYRTMSSRKAPGLFLAGEILDCDGRIGGFNFQWAWATGHLAGKTAGGAAAPLPAESGLPTSKA